MKLQGSVMGSVLLLSGCSMFLNESSSEALTTSHESVVMLSIGANSNLSPTGAPQPVKVCAWQRPQPNFVPENALDGSPCRTNSISDAPFFNDIMPPNSQKRLHVTSSGDAPYWVVIAAEFQRAGKSRSLLEIFVPGKAGVALNVRIERQTLFLQSKKRIQ
jgi:predicted component of type VI protein secretion system